MPDPTPGTTIPFLPKLKENNKLQIPSGPGLWEDRQRGRRLNVLSEAIVVPPEKTEIHSVPDPWARVILFARALYQPDHPSHAQILGEWRGALALLGLHELMGFTHLSVERVDLMASRPQSFTSILRRVLPDQGKNDTILQGDNWNSFYLLRAQNDGKTHAFGMTSPATLVATGASYPGAFKEHEVPWFRRNRDSGQWMLTDASDVLSKSERSGLAQWVLHLEYELQQQQAQHGLLPTRGGLMMNLLTDFANALDPESHLLQGILSDRGLRLDHGIAMMLAKPFRQQSDRISDLFLVTSRPGAAPTILIDLEANAKLHLEAKEIVVHQDISLASVRVRVPELSAANQGSFGTLGENEVRWCKPEFFFEDYLLFDANSQAGAMGGSVGEPFPGCRPVTTVGAPDSRRILLPLREDVMKLFDATFLQEHFTVEWKGDGSAQCELRLEVKQQFRAKPRANANGGTSTTGNGSVPVATAGEVPKTRTIVLSRRYSRDQQVRIPSLLPLGIWPNFSFLPSTTQGQQTRWKRYYLFESWRNESRTDDFIVHPPTSMTRPDDQAIVKGKDLFRVHRIPEFPEYLRCEMAPQESPEHFHVRPTALMLLKTPELLSAAGQRRAALGIDFGTTGTSIYWAWRDDERPQPTPIKFENRFFPITDYDQNELKRLTRDSFLPAQDWSSGKILSVYEVFREPGDREMLDGHVLFANEERPADFVAKESQGNVRSNLKWGGDDRQTSAAKGFLTQLCVEGLVELVKRDASSVDIRYSYPTAFSVEQQATFIGIWAGVLRKLADVTGMTLTDNADKVENREAVAATRFFSDRGARDGFNVASGGITIDIGGGTTDIAVWSRDAENNPALLSHLSILCAGRDIFLGAVRLRPGILAELDPSVALDSLTSKPQGSEAYNAQLDALVAANGEKMLQRLPETRERVQDFLDILGTGLCGLGFYSGMLAGRLIAAGAYQPRGTVPVYVGGNGSRLLDWCAIGNFNPGMTIYDNLAASILAGCRAGSPDFHAQVEIKLSSKPKEEVAYGLVARGLGGNNLELVVDDAFTMPLAGENFTVRDDQAAGWSGSPTAKQMREHVIEVDRALPLFHAFMEAADVQLDSRSLERISDTIDSRFMELSKGAKNLTGKNADQRALDPLRKEPPFILALKEVLGMQIDSWVRRG